MEGSWLAIIVLLAFGCAAGCVAYEGLVRRYAPPRVERAAGSAAGASPARGGAGGIRNFGRRRAGAAGTGAGSGETGSAAHRGAPTRFLAAAGRRIERVLPMTRADGDSYRTLIMRAGWRLEPETWRAARIVSAAGCGALACASSLTVGGATPTAACAATAVAAVAGWTAPRIVLARAIARRRRLIEAQLPDAMELLGIAIAAGSPVEQCFREVAQNLEQPLAGEFEAVDREVNLLGHSREQALDHLAARCESRDVSAFVAQLAQAVSQGSSIAEGLSSQAALARETAQAAALERIRKMPTKLDVILSFCFLPPTIALVVVPTVVDLLKFLNDTLQ